MENCFACVTGGSFISFADTKDKREINDKAVTEEICPCEMEGMDPEKLTIVRWQMRAYPNK